MTTRSYGQYCGLAHALEVVGERWALLLVRDLMTGGAKRFTDLRRGLPKIPTNVLSARLKQLESAGVVRRRLLARPETGVVYELTEYGHELEDILVRLGHWGAKSMGDPRPGDTVNAETFLFGLRAMFRPEAALGLRASYEVRLGDIVVHVRVDDGALEVADGPLPDADLALEADLRLRRVLSGELHPDEAIESGALRLRGDRELLDRFLEMFPTPAAVFALPA
ncbi:MAG: winged helix-turn-helix transcriptional regulator [Gaiellaceae bacterium]